MNNQERLAQLKGELDDLQGSADQHTTRRIRTRLSSIVDILIQQAAEAKRINLKNIASVCEQLKPILEEASRLAVIQSEDECEALRDLFSLYHEWGGDPELEKHLQQSITLSLNVHSAGINYLAWLTPNLRPYPMLYLMLKRNIEGIENDFAKNKETITNNLFDIYHNNLKPSVTDGLLRTEQDRQKYSRFIESIQRILTPCFSTGNMNLPEAVVKKILQIMTAYTRHIENTAYFKFCFSHTKQTTFQSLFDEHFLYNETEPRLPYVQDLLYDEKGKAGVSKQLRKLLPFFSFEHFLVRQRGIPLQIAVLGGYCHTVEFLLHHGAKSLWAVQAKTDLPHGLELSIKMAHFDIFLLFLHHGAKLTMKAGDGKSLLHHVIASAPTYFLDYLLGEKIIKPSMLLCIDGQSPYVIAAQRPESLYCLFSNGVTISPKNKGAVYQSMVSYLVEKGAPVALNSLLSHLMSRCFSNDEEKLVGFLNTVNDADGQGLLYTALAQYQKIGMENYRRIFDMFMDLKLPVLTKARSQLSCLSLLEFPVGEDPDKTVAKSLGKPCVEQLWRQGFNELLAKVNYYLESDINFKIPNLRQLLLIAGQLGYTGGMLVDNPESSQIVKQNYQLLFFVMYHAKQYKLPVYTLRQGVKKKGYEIFGEPQTLAQSAHNCLLGGSKRHIKPFANLAEQDPSALFESNGCSTPFDVFACLFLELRDGQNLSSDQLRVIHCVLLYCASEKTDAPLRVLIDCLRSCGKHSNKPITNFDSLMRYLMEVLQDDFLSQSFDLALLQPWLSDAQVISPVPFFAECALPVVDDVSNQFILLFQSMDSRAALLHFCNVMDALSQAQSNDIMNLCIKYAYKNTSQKASKVAESSMLYESVWERLLGLSEADAPGQYQQFWDYFIGLEHTQDGLNAVQKEALLEVTWPENCFEHIAVRG